MQIVNGEKLKEMLNNLKKNAMTYLIYIAVLNIAFELKAKGLISSTPYVILIITGVIILISTILEFYLRGKREILIPNKEEVINNE